MKTQNAKQTAYQNATLRIEFRIHLVVYLAVNALLAAINIMRSPGYLWFIWPLLGWGLGVIIHGIKVRLSVKPSMKERMIEKEIHKGNAQNT